MIKWTPISPRLAVCTAQLYEDVEAIIEFKRYDNWNVLIDPFVTKQEMVDSGEETTRAVSTEWTFVMHRF